MPDFRHTFVPTMRADHVLNRGNARAEVFHKDEDYAAFIGLFEPACERLRILGYCLMPNHFHLVLRPYGDGDLGPLDAVADDPPRAAVSPALPFQRPHQARAVQDLPNPGGWT